MTSFYSRADAWKQTIFENNLNNLPNADTCFNTGRIKIVVDMAVADAGATGHFVLPGTPVIDVHGYGFNVHKRRQMRTPRRKNPHQFALNIRQSKVLSLLQIWI